MPASREMIREDGHCVKFLVFLWVCIEHFRHTRFEEVNAAPEVAVSPSPAIGAGCDEAGE